MCVSLTGSHRRAKAGCRGASEVRPTGHVSRFTGLCGPLDSMHTPCVSYIDRDAQVGPKGRPKGKGTDKPKTTKAHHMCVASTREEKRAQTQTQKQGGSTDQNQPLGSTITQKATPHLELVAMHDTKPQMRNQGTLLEVLCKLPPTGAQAPGASSHSVFQLILLPLTNAYASAVCEEDQPRRATSCKRPKLFGNEWD